MHRRFFLTVMTVMLFARCASDTGTPAQGLPPLPEAMEPPESYSLSKRGHSDRVRSIYENLLKSSPALKQMEDQTEKVLDARSDTLEAVTEYLHQVNNYYQSADRHAGNIKDSVLRQKLLRLLKESKDRFAYRSRPYTLTMDSIEQAVIDIRDRREMVQVILTLPVIQEFERRNGPPVKSLQQYNGALEKRKATMDSLLRKPGG